MEQLYGYETLELLGRGSYGTVFRCLRLVDNTECCIKHIHFRDNDVAKVEEQSTLVKREIYILINLRHPRIIQLLEYFNHGDDIYIVMEYANNGTLQNLIDHRFLDQFFFQENEILNYFCDILQGIEYLHIKHIIHRDLKTENILIDAYGNLKISDFGVSIIKSIDNSDIIHYGTPLYMSPEALEYSIFGFASDIWALGCIFYELCMLQHPFNHSLDLEDLLKLVKAAAYHPIDVYQLNYHNSFKKLCNLMLEPCAQRRASIMMLVCQPIVTKLYYHKYFNYYIS